MKRPLATAPCSAPAPPPLRGSAWRPRLQVALLLALGCSRAWGVQWQGERNVTNSLGVVVATPNASFGPSDLSWRDEHEANQHKMFVDLDTIKAQLQEIQHGQDIGAAG